MEGFVFYKSFRDAAMMLRPEERLALYDAITEYGIEGEITSALPGTVGALFTLIKPQLDANAAKKTAGKRGGRPRLSEDKTDGFENEKPMVYEDENHRLENEKPKVKEKVKEKVKDKEKEVEEKESAGSGRNPSLAAISLPLNDGTEYDVTFDKLNTWSELYPAVDVMQELRNMRGWLESNKSRRKTRRGIEAFCTSWLAREQNRGPARPAARRVGISQEKAGVTRGTDFDALALEAVVGG